MNKEKRKKGKRNIDKGKIKKVNKENDEKDKG